MFPKFLKTLRGSQSCQVPLLVLLLQDTCYLFSQALLFFPLLGQLSQVFFYRAIIVESLQNSQRSFAFYRIQQALSFLLFYQFQDLILLTALQIILQAWYCAILPIYQYLTPSRQFLIGGVPNSISIVLARVVLYIPNTFLRQEAQVLFSVPLILFSVSFATVQTWALYSIASLTITLNITLAFLKVAPYNDAISLLINCLFLFALT